MTDPRVLIRLDVIVGLLGLIAALLALQLVALVGQLGLIAVVLVGLAAGLAAREYRRVIDEGAAG